VVRRNWYFLAILLIAAGFQAVSAVYYLREQSFLEAYLERSASPSLPPSEQAKSLVLSLKSNPEEDNDSYFLLPIFRPLRPTARQVIEIGGDCADRSRLIITLLHLRGIRSEKWALYDAQGESVHAAVEADVESGKMVVDPLFGIWFPKPGGGYYAIDDLRRDPSILDRRIAELREQAVQPGAHPLRLYPLNKYVYTSARTINWNKGFLMKGAYWVLRHTIGAGTDKIGRPEFVEEPPLMVIYGMGGIEIVALLAWLALARRRRKAAAVK